MGGRAFTSLLKGGIVPPDGRLLPYRELSEKWQTQLLGLARNWGMRRAVLLEAGLVVTRVPKRRSSTSYDWVAQSIAAVPPEWAPLLPTEPSPFPILLDTAMLPQLRG